MPGKAGMLVGATTVAALGLILKFSLPYVRSAETDFSRFVYAARSIKAGLSPYTVYDFDYPPLLAFLLVPIVDADLHNLNWFWFCGNLATLITAAAVFWARFHKSPEGAVAVAIVWGMLAATPQSLALGQLNPLLLFLVVLWWPGTGKDSAARGIPLGLACALKLWPTSLLIVDIYRRSWRAVFAAGLLFVVLLTIPSIAISYFLLGPTGPGSAWYWLGTPSLFNLSYTGWLLRLSELPNVGEPLPQSWVVGNTPSGLAAAGFQAGSSAKAGFVLVSLSLFVMLLLLIRRRLCQISPVRLPALMISATLAVAPLVWAHYYMLNYPALSLLLADALKRRRKGRILCLLLLAVFLTWLPTMGIDAYINRFASTYAWPALLWAITTLPFLANIALFMDLLRVPMEHVR